MPKKPLTKSNTSKIQYVERLSQKLHIFVGATKMAQMIEALFKPLATKSKL